MNTITINSEAIAIIAAAMQLGIAEPYELTISKYGVLVNNTETHKSWNARKTDGGDIAINEFDREENW